MNWFFSNKNKTINEEKETSITDSANENFVSDKITAEPEPTYMEKLAQDAPKIHAALELMRQYSSLGERIVFWAKENDIQFSEKEMSYGGVCDSKSNPIQVITNINNSIDENIAVLAHELMHAVQTKRDLIYVDLINFDSIAFILHNRAMESAAETFAVKICYEMKQKGYTKAFDLYAKNELYYNELFKIYEHTYQKYVNNGKTHDDAIQQACDDTFHAYYKYQPLIDAYNDTALKDYTQLLRYGVYENEYPSTAFGEVSSRQLTEIDEGEFLVTKVKPDISDKGLFGNNVRMQQAFAYVEHVRLLITAGADTNFGVQRSQQRLVDNKNPYLELDISKVLDILKERETNADNKKNISIIKIMNELSDTTNPKQTSLFQFVFDDASEKKAETQKAADIKVTIPQTNTQTEPARIMKSACL